MTPGRVGGPPTSPTAWIEVLHAEIGFRLARAGIPVLHIKGPTVTSWLYSPGERAPGDVDVLVPPERMEQALEVLTDGGFTERYGGVNRRTSTDHAIALRRADSALGLDEVDVHDRFEGMDAHPERAFALLWARREPATLGHVHVWFPDRSSRALLVALNTARSSRSPQSLEDLTRLIRPSSLVDWPDVLSLGRGVHALPALRAGLELTPAGRELVAELALDSVPISTEFQLRVSLAPRTALRLDELRRLTWRQRPRALWRWLVPPAALVRMRDPRATGPAGLTGAYLRRLAQGFVGLPAAVRALRALSRR